MKICTKCLNAKPDDSFSLRYDRAAGQRRRDCRACEAQRRAGFAVGEPRVRAPRIEPEPVVDHAPLNAALRDWRGPVRRAPMRSTP